MSKVLLINPALSLEQRYGKSATQTMHHTPPQGLCYLAAVVRKNGYDVAIIDAEVLPYSNAELLARVKEYAPDYIGITSTIVTIFTAADYVKMFRQNIKGAKIILGGPQITACPERTMELLPDLDAGVLGEGEITIIELLKALENNQNLEAVPGLILARDGKSVRTEKREFIQNLDVLPMPAWDLLPELARYYRTSEITYKRLPAFQIVTSRGCPFRCTFCDRSVFGNEWRSFSAEYVLKMVKELTNKYGIKDLNFGDDEFLINKKRITKICQYLIDEKIDLTWSAVGRVSSVMPEILKLAKKAGCHQIAYGLESGSQKILDIINKKLTKEEIIRGVRWTKEAGIEVKGLFMVGCPLETEETIKETRELIEMLDLDYISMAAFTPLPGAEVYETATKYGTFDDDWHKMNLWQHIFVPFGLNEEQLGFFVGRYSRKESKTKYLREK